MIEIVNGYPCKTCTDVDYAKKFIDPAHPKDGAKPQGHGDQAAFVFGGSLTGLNPIRPPTETERPHLDLRV